MADTNKVKFGLKNVYYAVATEATNGTLTFATPVAIPGAVNLALDPEGADPTPFYADNMVYYMAPGANNGYTGSLEVAKVVDSFFTDVLGDITDSNGIRLENADASSKTFALLFEFNGDKEATRHVMYSCTAQRPSVGSATTEDVAEPQTETLNLTAIPMKVIAGTGTTTTEYHVVKGKADATGAATKYATWFTTVAVPAITPA